jgi:apolipoprotein N-acyltransferase
MAEVFFRRQLELTAAPPRDGGATPDLIVWPETAIPWVLGRAQPALEQIAAAAGQRPVALGALRFEGDRLRNALAVLGPTGEVAALYDKHHLVPFGEYVPFEAVVERLGLRALAASMGGFSSGPGPELLDFGALGAALPLICYEAVFAHGVGAVRARPSFLLQVTNDAWFGTYAGPQQHLAQARMRAIEQGLPLARAANTGISAMVGPTGRVLQALPLNEAGFIDAPLPKALPPTLYSKWGDWPVIFLLIIGLAGVVITTRP